MRGQGCLGEACFNALKIVHTVGLPQLNQQVGTREALAIDFAEIVFGACVGGKHRAGCQGGYEI